MKKIIYTIALVLCGIMPLHAVEEKKSFARRTQDTVMKQLQESYDRFKKCVHGNCTKTELLKVTRDLSIAAVALITISYKLFND